MTTALWIAVGAIAVATYLTRALPFLLAERRRGSGSPRIEGPEGARVLGVLIPIDDFTARATGVQVHHG